MKITSLLDIGNFKLKKDCYPYVTYKLAINKSKYNVVFIHGYGFDSSYHNFFANLDNDYNYYAIELPGHGVTPLKKESDLKPHIYAKMIISLLKELNLKQIYLIGHSMGGGIAMMVASQMKDVIKKLVLVCPMNSFGTTNIKDFLFNFNPRTHKQAEKFYDIVLHNKQWLNDEWSEIIIDQMLKINNEHHKELKILKNNMISPTNILNLLKAESKLKIPTLLMVGKYDKCINPITTISNLKLKIDNLRIIKFNESGHIPMFEELGKYRNEIISFFDKKD